MSVQVDASVHRRSSCRWGACWPTLRIEAPPFQRSFAWKIDQAGRCWTISLTALDETEERGTSEYFLGTMLFIDRSRPRLHARDCPGRARVRAPSARSKSSTACSA